MSFSCYHFFFLVTFFKVFVQFFFFCTYLCSARRVRSDEETSDVTSGMGCIIYSLSSGIFGRKCKVSEEHGFRKQATVSP